MYYSLIPYLIIGLEIYFVDKDRVKRRAWSARNLSISESRSKMSRQKVQSKICKSSVQRIIRRRAFNGLAVSRGVNSREKLFHTLPHRGH